VKLEEAIEIVKSSASVSAFSSDLVLVMTKHPEFEQNARFTPVEWTPEKTVGEITFIDGNKYRVTVEVVRD
jgi:hypothetical protein